jgi:hypothetical protein
MGSFSFTTEIKEDRTLQLPAGSPIGRVTVAITPAEEAAPTGRRLLAKLLELQAAIPVAAGLSQEQIDTALERERAFQLFQAPIEVLRLEPDQPLNQQT